MCAAEDSTLLFDHRVPVPPRHPQQLHRQAQPNANTVNGREDRRFGQPAIVVYVSLTTGRASYSDADHDASR